MKGIRKVIYWHRFGQKVYEIPVNASPILEKEISSGELDDIKEGLEYLKNQSVLLLLSDSISYLYEKIIDPPLEVNEGFRAKLQELIKADIPEDFSEFAWDYKVENNFDGKQKVIVFAPIKEFQTVIDEVSKELMIKIEAMETESVAASRDPNPILGIMKKPDIKGRDDEVLNLEMEPEDENKKFSFKTLALVLLLILIVAGVVVLAIKLKSILPKSTKKAPGVTITMPRPIPSEVPMATPVKSWEELNVIVQNGTAQAGLASKTAQIFKDSGVTQVESGNADSKDYTVNKLIFKSELLKQSYLEKVKKLVSIKDENINVDESMTGDLVVILGSGEVSR